MKKIAALCIGVGCMLTVTGCGSNVTLNTEQNDMVSEYGECSGSTLQLRPTCTATEEPQIKRKICIIQENLYRSEKRF